MKTSLLSFFLILFSGIVFGQNFEWAISIPSANNADANSGTRVVVDANKNVITTGYFEGTIDFDPGTGVFNMTGSNLFRNIFISKLDSNGAFVWAKQFSSPGYNNEILDVTTDPNGNIYTTGHYEGLTDFDPGSNVYNLSNPIVPSYFVSKLDLNGNFVWAKELSGPFYNDASGKGISVDDNGGVYTTGTFSGDTVDFDPGPGVAYLFAFNQSIFVSKLDSNGNFIWAKGFESSYSSEGDFIKNDNLGNTYIAGDFLGTVDFDPGLGVTNLTSSGSHDNFICKLDSNGNFVWAQKFGGVNYDEIYDLNIDVNNNVYTTGIFQGTVDFDPGTGIYNLSTTMTYGHFLSKLSPNGNFIWAQKVADGTLYAEGLSSDLQGDLYITGEFKNTIDFDPGSGVSNFTSLGDWDIFVSKLDSSGNHYWTKQMGGPGWNLAKDIFVTNDEDILTTGSFSNTVDFDPGLGNFYLSSLNFGVFVCKLGDCSINNSIVISGCDSAMANGTTYTSSTSFTVHDTTLTGCDSNTNYEVNIHTSTSNNISLSGCNSIDINGQTYNSSGTYTQILTNSHGCDSTLNIAVTITTIDTTINLNGITLSANQNSTNYQWYNCENNSLINGATSQSFTPVANGSYAVIISLNGCSDTSACTPILTIGTNDISKKENYQILPNPNNGRFVIQSNNVSNASIKIYNSVGSLVLSKDNLTFKKKEVNIEHLTAGIYFLEINAKKNSYRYKIIRE